MPDFKKVHLIDARLPQECIAITSHDFRSYSFESMSAVHSYRAWHDRQDKRPEYEFHRQFLQHLQWRCPGQRWVLKAPGHLLALEALLQVYPDACIIMTHRDPLKVLASCASFTEVLRSAFSDRVDKVAMARQVRQRWEEGAGLAVKYRQAGNLRQQLFDVQYLELVRDPMSMVRRIYEHFDLELTRAAETAMQRFLAEQPQEQRRGAPLFPGRVRVKPRGGETPLSILPGLFRHRAGRVMTWRAGGALPGKVRNQPPVVVGGKAVAGLDTGGFILRRRSDKKKRPGGRFSVQSGWDGPAGSSVSTDSVSARLSIPSSVSPGISSSDSVMILPWRRFILSSFFCFRAISLARFCQP